MTQSRHATNLIVPKPPPPQKNKIKDIGLPVNYIVGKRTVMYVRRPGVATQRETALY